MTAQITNNDAENPATGVSVKALLNSAQLSWVNGYGTETAGAGAYAVDSNNTADLPDGSANGYDQIVMWTDQTIGAGEAVAYQFAAQIIPENLDGVVNAWYVDGTSCSYTWENAEILVPAQAPVESTPEVAPPQTEPEEKPEVKPEETTPEVTEAPEVTPTPEVTEVPEATPTPEVTEVPEATPTPEPTQAADDDKQAKLDEQNKLLGQSKDRRKIQKAAKAQANDDENDQSDSENSTSVITDKSNIMCQGNTVHVSLSINNKDVDTSQNITIGRDDKISLHVEYKYYENNKPKAAENNGGVLDNVRYYNLPAQGWTYSNTQGPIKNGNETVGSYEIVNDGGNVRVKLIYKESFLKDYPNEIEGTFTLKMQVDKDYVAGSETTTIDFPGLTKSVTLKPSDLK